MHQNSPTPGAHHADPPSPCCPNEASSQSPETQRHWGLQPGHVSVREVGPRPPGCGPLGSALSTPWREGSQLLPGESECAPLTWGGGSPRACSLQGESSLAQLPLGRNLRFWSRRGLWETLRVPVSWALSSSGSSAGTVRFLQEAAVRLWAGGRGPGTTGSCGNYFLLMRVKVAPSPETATTQGSTTLTAEHLGVCFWESNQIKSRKGFPQACRPATADPAFDSVS